MASPAERVERAAEEHEGINDGDEGKVSFHF